MFPYNNLSNTRYTLELNAQTANGNMKSKNTNFQKRAECSQQMDLSDKVWECAASELLQNKDYNGSPVVIERKLYYVVKETVNELNEHQLLNKDHIS